MGDIGDYDDHDREHEHEHEVPPFRRRSLVNMETMDGSEIIIDHLYPATENMEPCPSCGGQCVAPGMVGMVLDDSSGLFTPEEALLIANRLIRGANLVLETMEDRPDLSREAAMLGLPPGIKP